MLGNSPDNLLASRLLAALLIRQGRRDDAAPVVDRLLELSPDDDEGLKFLSQLEGQEPPAAPVGGPAEEPRGEQIRTSTLARLYEEQGLHEKALGVYETLLAANPENNEIADRAAALRARLAGEPAEPPAEPPADPATAEQARKKIDRLGRLLDAARILAPDRSERD